MTKPLSPSQANALFDILTHYQTYCEIQDFKLPATVTEYGFPFSKDGSGTPAPASSTSGSPILHMLLNKFVLTIPGITGLQPDFWTVRAQGVLASFARAGLSESYDKGALGTRKTLATAASAVIELLARGVIGGYPGHFIPSDDAKSEAPGAVNLAQAWDESINGAIHGTLVDDLFEWMIDHDSPEDFSPAVKGAADYTIIQWVGFSAYI